MTFSPNASTVYADGPSTDPYEPSKAQIRALLTQYENAIDAFSSGAGSIAKSTRALLFADLAHDADVTAWVYADPTTAFNGIYRKSGASGSGSWSLILPLPYSFIIASDVGAGTPNAIQATTSIPVSSSALVWVTLADTTTDSPVTISFNGDTALTIKTNSGNDPAAGGLAAGMTILGIKAGSTFRILNDQISSAIVAAAEAAADRAEDARDAALGAVSNVFALTRTALKALDTTIITAAYLKEADRQGQWLWKTGDFSTQIAADTNEGLYLKASAIAATSGAWVRQYDGNVLARWFGAGQAAIQAAQGLGDDVEIDRAFAITSTATWPKGKRYYFKGVGELDVATGVTLTIRGLVVAGKWRNIPSGTPTPNMIFNCTGTGKVLGLAEVWPEYWGAKGDTVNGVGTNDQPALQAAHDCCEASVGSEGGRPTIHLGLGATYGMSATWELRPTLFFNLKIDGAGSTSGSKIQPLATFTGTDLVHIAGKTNGIGSAEVDFEIGGFALDFVVGVSNAACVNGLRLSDTGKEIQSFALSSIRDLRINAFKIGVLMNGTVRLIRWERLSIWAGSQANSICLSIDVGLNGFIGDQEFTQGCQFVANSAVSTSKAIQIVNNQTYTAGPFNQVAGIRFHGIITYFGNPAVSIFAGNGGHIHDIWFTGGCQHDAEVAGHYAITASGSGSIIDTITIEDSWMFAFTTGVPSVLVQQLSGGVVNGFRFRHNHQSEMQHANGVSCLQAAFNGGEIIGNEMRNISNPTGFAMSITAANFTMMGNQLFREAGNSATVSGFIVLQSGCFNMVAANNNSGGGSTTPMSDLSGAVTKAVANNI
ncbi:hypothetical protein [Rhizobium rhizogenes]|uniref:hypothetical protein n=1 Tax=Rhizobium rhizogenes TaxID=359 RepID=UPI00068ED112|nr:hypothetical protein [Rhizobium rhizogenes]QUE80973.1 hypothetical protein EML492_03950 [Rhizobium rhizogenes]